MNHQRVRFAAAVTSMAIAFASGGMALADGSEASAPTITPIIGGLNNPRGIALDPQGGLYVAEAGRFLGDGSTIQSGVTTGYVSKWARRGTPAPQKVWATPFNALYTNERGIPEVIGPSGLSALGNGCTKNSRGQRRGCALYTIVGESGSGFEAENPGVPAPSQIGHLFRLNPASGSPTDAGDVGNQQYQWAADHADLWEEFPDSNPYGVLVTRDPDTDEMRTYVADAGANTLLEVYPDGSTRVIAYIPNDGVRDSTPTCVAQGPDGALYLGTLNLFKNGFGDDPGHSDVWRVDPNTTEDFLSAAHLWATGLTTVTSCTFDGSGSFWATEMFQPNVGGPPGDIVRIPFQSPTTLERIGGGQLPFPGGIAAGPDGAYVTINSITFAPDTGAVVKVSME
jgi:sugar lactone lactonase YvrE